MCCMSGQRFMLHQCKLNEAVKNLPLHASRCAEGIYGNGDRTFRTSARKKGTQRKAVRDEEDSRCPAPAAGMRDWHV